MLSEHELLKDREELWFLCILKSYSACGINVLNLIYVSIKIQKKYNYICNCVKLKRFKI